MSIERPEVEGVIVDGVIVEGRHPVTFEGTCLTCGRPDYSPGCGGLGVPLYDFGEPEPT